MPPPPSSETTGRTLTIIGPSIPSGPEPRRRAERAWISHQVQAMAAAWARGERISPPKILWPNTPI